MIPQMKRILYATDLSKNSSYAFLYAVDIARRHNASIVILHSIELSSRYALEERSLLVEEVLQKARKQEQKQEQEMNLGKVTKRLQEFCNRMDEQIGSPCVELVSKILVPMGHPVEEILKAADEEGCDTIVLGTHGKGFLRQTFLGSVAGSVLERSRKPVFIIPLPSEKTDIDWNKL